MNTFEQARLANDAVRDHVCTSKCVRNSDGYCFVKLGLWRAQRAAALAWNAPAVENAPVEGRYL